MDRSIKNQKPAKFTWFKAFEYGDLFPYTIALLMAGGEVYILTTFISLAHSMH